MHFCANRALPLARMKQRSRGLALVCATPHAIHGRNLLCIHMIEQCIANSHAISDELSQEVATTCALESRHKTPQRGAMEIATAARMQASSHGGSAHLWKSRYGGAILHGGTAPDAQPPRPAGHLRARQQRHRRGEECLALSTTVVLCTARREPRWMGATRGPWKRMRRARAAANEEEAVRWHGPRDARH